MSAATSGPVEISEPVLDEFAAACRAALKKHLTEPPQQFTLRMSNIGRPKCQLQLEKSGAPREADGYNHVLRMLQGDLGEALIIALLKAAGVNVEKQQEPVALDIAGVTIQGTYDVLIDGQVWDIKTASPYSYSYKFNTSYDNFVRGDTLGYVGQGYGYALAAGAPFGGWIVMDKSSGEINVLEASQDPGEYKRVQEALAKTVSEVIEDEPFSRCFEDVAEIHRKKLTGNRILSVPCQLCPYKFTCWPEVQIRGAVMSEAQNPPLRYYTHIDEKYVDSKQKGESENPTETS